MTFSSAHYSTADTSVLQLSVWTRPHCSISLSAHARHYWIYLIDGANYCGPSVHQQHDPNPQQTAAVSSAPLPGRARWHWLAPTLTTQCWAAQHSGLRYTTGELGQVRLQARPLGRQAFKAHKSCWPQRRACLSSRGPATALLPQYPALHPAQPPRLRHSHLYSAKHVSKFGVVYRAVPNSPSLCCQQIV